MFKIICDYREKSSGLPKLLENNKVGIYFSSLVTGDYIINDEIIVERKTAEDFIQSIINCRLFDQCSRLKKESKRILILIEENPYKTKHDIKESAIRGAIISILTAWQIPIIYSQNIDRSAEIILMLGRQTLKENVYIRIHNSPKPKKTKSQKLSFLQGIPSTGPVIAGRLLESFGTIKSIVNADDAELRKIKGIGKKNSKNIIDFFQSEQIKKVHSVL